MATGIVTDSADGVKERTCGRMDLANGYVVVVHLGDQFRRLRLRAQDRDFSGGTRRDRYGAI